MDWLRAERPSESTSANSVATLLPGIIARRRHYAGEPGVIRGGLLSKNGVEAIISGVRLEMEEIKKENTEWREAEIIAEAARLGLSPEPSGLDPGLWIAHCPRTNHSLLIQPKRNQFYCGYCRVGGGIDELLEFVSKRRSKTPRLA
jgi:hypothetical protein